MQSTELLKECEDKAGYGISLVKLGAAKLGQKIYEEAEDLIIEGIEVLKKADHWFFLMTAYGHLAELFLEIEDYRDALISLEKAEAILESQPDKESYSRRKAQSCGMIACIYAKWGQLEKSKEWLDKSMAILNSPDITEEAKKVILKDIRFEETKKLLAHNQE